MGNKRTGGRILVDQLRIQGVDRIFSVPGESYLAVLDALCDVPEIENIVCRQEGGVTYMACADGTLTGRPGVAFVTRGPGATNASIGVHVAMQDSIPMILFIGDIDRGMRDREGFQEVDFPAMFSPLAKWATRIEDAARIPEYLARAFHMAISGRPGPVVIALPEDMLLDEVEALDRPRVQPPRIEVAIEAERKAISALAAAKHPMIIAGGADWDEHTGAGVQAFAEQHGIPIATAFRRQHCISPHSPVYAGNLGYGPNPKLIARIKASDAIMVVGARLGEATTDGYTVITPDHPGQTLIHIHPDPAEIHRVFRTDIAICASLSPFASDIAHSIITDTHFPDGAEAHAEWLEWSTPQPFDTPLDLGQCVAAMREICPPDSIICNGAGNFSGWWHRYWRYDGFGTQLAPTNGSMGFGVPAAVAACLRRPDRCVVALTGDGDFMMNGQELATAAQYGCNLLVILVDNGSYGTIRMHQEREFPVRVSGTNLINPDFAMLTRAFGGWAESVETTQEFAPALERAMGRTGLRMLHLKTDVERISAGTTISALRGR